MNYFFYFAVALEFSFLETFFNVSETDSHVTICLSRTSGDIADQIVAIEVTTQNGTAIGKVSAYRLLY